MSGPRWDVLEDCCREVVMKYLEGYDPPRLHAVLFCPTCSSRIVNTGPSWEVET